MPDEPKLIEVCTGDFKITDSDRLFCTLASNDQLVCPNVAVALFAPFKDHFVRGLVQMYHDGSVDYDLSLAEEELSGFISNFPERKDLAAVVSGVPFARNGLGYFSPVIELSERALRDAGIKQYIVCNSRELRTGYPSRLRTVTEKQVALHPDKIAIAHKSNSSVIKLETLDYLEVLEYLKDTKAASQSE